MFSFIFSVYGSIFKSKSTLNVEQKVTVSVIYTLLLLNCMRMIKERYGTLQTSVACASMNPFWCLAMSPLTWCQELK